MKIQIENDKTGITIWEIQETGMERMLSSNTDNGRLDFSVHDEYRNIQFNLYQIAEYFKEITEGESDKTKGFTEGDLPF